MEMDQLEAQMQLLEAEDESKRRNGIFHYINPYIKGLAHLLPPPRPAQFIRESRKINRNEMCPCGSGKKYKKCCEKINPA